MILFFAALRHCFRCNECHSTLLPGSYKLGVVSGALVCRHHAARSASDNQNGRPDLSKRPPAVQSARIGRSGSPHTAPPPESERTNDSNEAAAADDSLEIREDVGETEETSHSAAPPNPFDESDDEEEEEETKEEEEVPAQLTANGELPPPPTLAAHQEGAGRPVPAPRRVLEPSPPPRPAPRVRLLRTSDGPFAPPRLKTREVAAVNDEILTRCFTKMFAGDNQKPPTPPKPRERSQSPGR